MAGYFYSDSVVTLESMVKVSREVELHFSEKREQSDLSHFLLHRIRTRKEVSSGGISVLKLCLQLPAGDNLMYLSSGKKMISSYIVMYQLSFLCQLWECIYNVQVM